MTPMTERAGWRWVSLGAALLLVNLAPSFHNVWPTPWVTVRPELSVEAAVIVLLVVIVGRRGAVSPRLIGALAIVMMLLAAARYMEVTAPALYGRAINLYWDTQHLPAVVAMLAESVSAWRLAAGVLGLGVLLVAAWLAFRWALTRIASTAAPEGRVLAALSGAIAVAYVFGYYASVAPILRWFSIPVTQTYVRQIEFVADALAGRGAAADLPVVDPFAGWSWPARPRADVLVVFVESYGAVAYDAETVAAALAAHRARVAVAVAESGSEVVSAFVTSPTFGGVSWLAHASFMTGIDVTDSGAYNVLLTQERETLVDRFAAAGYRTLALMPGLRGDWPEGSFYGFDEIYGERAIEYAGPEFGWWRVPDQYALARLDAVEVGVAARAPLLVFFPTISTHMPFRPTPPYQPDWHALTGPVPYTPEMLAGTALAAPDLMDLRPAYAGALAYTYDYLSGYVSRGSERDQVLVIVGDHQPPASVAGEGARWDVPVHVIARDSSVLDAFRAAGFVAGIEPAPAPIGRTHELGALLLEALGAARVGE